MKPALKLWPSRLVMNGDLDGVNPKVGNKKDSVTAAWAKTKGKESFQVLI